MDLGVPVTLARRGESLRDNRCMSAETPYDDIPPLEGDALAAVRHRGGHMQIIAAAGSGKTEVVSQHVADLLADRVAPFLSRVLAHGYPYGAVSGGDGEPPGPGGSGGIGCEGYIDPAAELGGAQT